jgi:curved DNA-binding protein CbpA
MAKKSHYEVLMVRPDASTDEVRRTYHRLAREHHPDRHLPGPAKKKAEELFAAMTEAFNVLTNPERRREYDAKLRTEATTGDPAQAEARNYFRAGTVKLNEGNGKDAVRLFQAAIHLDSTQASYYAHYAKALELSEAYGEAGRQWDEAIRREPYNQKYYRLAGQCLERAGMKIRARKMYEKALEWDRNDAVSSEALRRLGGGGEKKGILGGLFKRS